MTPDDDASYAAFVARLNAPPRPVPAHDPAAGIARALARVDPAKAERPKRYGKQWWRRWQANA